MTDIGIIDTTIRDGNQSLWATRMTTEMILPILPAMDAAGFHSIEYTSSVHIDAPIRYLGEDPWERMREVRTRVKRTPLRMIGMSQMFSISSVLPDDVVELFTKVLARYVDHQWITASMNDVRTAEAGIRAARDAGNRIEGGVQFTVSPIHTDDFFVEVVHGLVALGIDGVVVKDAGGLLTPDRARTLFPRVVEAAGGLPVLCHSHCTTGLGPASNIAAIEHGASAVWTCTRPLANGPSLPATDSMVEGLGWMGYETSTDRVRIAEIAEHFAEVARNHDKPVGRPAEYDPRYYAHQMPGGMISNFRSQLKELGMEERLDEVLEEMPRVREELGYPNIQTPYSQFVATQALLNVVYGRYERVPDEIKRYVLGYWGRTPGPVDPDVLDRIGGGEEPVTERPGSLMPPLVEKVRREQGPFASDEELLLAIFFMPAVLKQWREQMSAKHRFLAAPSNLSLIGLVRQAAASRGVRSFTFIDRGATET